MKLLCPAVPADFYSSLNTRRLIQSGRGHGSNGSGERNTPVTVYPADLGKKKNFVVSPQGTPSCCCASRYQPECNQDANLFSSMIRCALRVRGH